jgi:hypothetical protein
VGRKAAVFAGKVLKIADESEHEAKVLFDVK